MITEDLREIMAELGFKTIDEMVGQSECLQVREGITNWKYKNLQLSAILYKTPESNETGLFNSEVQDHLLNELLDWKLLQAAEPALKHGQKVKAAFPIFNTDRTTGTILSNEITKLYRAAGLPEGSIHFKFTGTAGQSFGAFNTNGVTLELEGDANDYFGKGLSGAQLIVYPSQQAKFSAEENIIIGNVALYGATSGEAFIRGKAGERFAVRNSGANVVVESVGDHGCEYMTGGHVLILGETGRNFAAGMSGGIAYIFDIKGNFHSCCNTDKGNFHSCCNTEMVDLDSCNETDKALIQTMLKKHVSYTGSSAGNFILNDIENQLQHFVKVFPKDYKKVLQRKAVLTGNNNL